MQKCAFSKNADMDLKLAMRQLLTDDADNKQKNNFF